MPKRHVVSKGVHSVHNGSKFGATSTASHGKSAKGKGGRSSCSPILAIFSVIGLLQAAILIYFLLGYVTGPSKPTPEAAQFLDEIDSDAPPGVQRNVVHHDQDQPPVRDSEVQPRSDDAASASSLPKENAPLASGPNVRERQQNRVAVFEDKEKYSPTDEWLNARPEWRDNPLREIPRAPPKHWDAEAKSAPKFPSQAELDSIYAKVERMYIAETEANHNGRGGGQFTLSPTSSMPGAVGKQCLDNLGHGVGDTVGVFSCHGSGGSQAWSYKAGRICQTAVKKQVCLTVVDRNRGKPGKDAEYAVEFQPEQTTAKTASAQNAQLWDMKMKTVHGDVAIKSKVETADTEGLCLVVLSDTRDGDIPVVGVRQCSNTATWSKEVLQLAKNKPAAVDPDYEEYAFNKPLSMQIGVRREEPERRPQQCLHGEHFPTGILRP